MKNGYSIHFAAGFLMIVFVILYVWQNISVMKIRMEYRDLVKKERELFKAHDKLLFDIETLRRIDVVEAIARERGMQRISPLNMQTMITGKKGK